MKWRGREASRNVEDRRGQSGGGTMRRVGAPIGCGGIVVLLLVVFLGGDVGQFLQQQGQTEQHSPQQQQAPTEARPDDDLAEFVKVIQRDTEKVWDKIFKQYGQQYQPPVLVIFDDNVTSACGAASAAMGPFYCPGDDRVYIDLSFSQELHRRFQAPGDAALAYVVAHEVAHHVQNLLGYTDRVNRQRGRVSEVTQNQLSVRLELQADYLAGVFMYHAEKDYDILEDGDIEEALNCAKQIGDDKIQKRARGYVVQESFTHGTSRQRMRYFKEGLRTGKVDNLDYFFDSDQL